MAQVYVKDSVMTEWKLKMDTINQNCITDIEGIESAIQKLNDFLRGDYAEQYESSIKSFLGKVKTSHEDLKNVENFLDEIVEVMQNQ